MAVDIMQTTSTGYKSNPDVFFRENFVPRDSRKAHRLRELLTTVAEKIDISGDSYRGGYAAAGFTIDEEDMIKCNDCGLKINIKEVKVNLYQVHRERHPNCPFITSNKKPSYIQNILSTANLSRTTTTFNHVENPSKRLKTDDTYSESIFVSLAETSTLEQARRRTFSNAPQRTLPSSAQFIEAGFFNCNVGDRVICLYCNLICQQWVAHTDDPCEIHKILKPNCIFVKACLVRPSASSITILNEQAVGAVVAGGQISSHLSPDIIKSSEIVYTTPANPSFIELPKRFATFTNWPKDNLPSIENLTRAGFFYTGTRSIVTCFYCNGSLQNWGPGDNPMIEHARWFPNCAYAKQLCGDDLYRKVQESKRAQQEKQRISEMKEKSNANAVATSNTNSCLNNRQLVIQDESTLSRLVAARLDLPLSQRLLSLGFKLSIIKRCWEDQLRLKRDDFASDTDLYIACLILKRQIEHIDGKKENIVIPSIKMKQLREKSQQEDVNGSENPIGGTGRSIASGSSSNTSTDEAQPSSTREVVEKSNEKTGANESKKSTNESAPSNQCVLCWNEEKRLACIPCGHLATCVPCGHSLRSCPICRREIEAFVRVYI